MLMLALSKEARKKYPEYGYSALNAVEKYIKDQIVNHEHGRQFLYHDIEKDTGYPIDWLRSVIKYGGHHGITLSEDDIKQFKGEI